MSKGKKFNAAEQHFEKKRIAMQREIDSYKARISELTIMCDGLEKQLSCTETENTNLKDWVERLLDYTQLSEDDIKKVCEADKKRGESLNAFVSMANILNRYVM